MLIKMRFSAIFLLLSLFGQTDAWAAPDAKDSLLHVLSTETSVDRQIVLYRDLADLSCEMPDEKKYLRLLSEKAQAAGKNDVALEALSDLVIAYVISDQQDSARYYFSQVERLAPREDRDMWLCYLSMTTFYFEVQIGKNDKVVEEKLKEYRAKKGDKESLYRQIETAYSLGVSFLAQDKYAEAEPYLADAVGLARKLPFKEGFRYQSLTMRRLAKTYSPLKKNAQSIALLDEVIRLQERYFDQYYKDTRPFYPMDDFYILIYTTILFNVEFMPQEQTEYYLDRLLELCKDSDKPSDKYNCFLSIGNYYLIREDWKNGLIYNDSLIKYASQLAVYNLPSLYNTSSQVYEKMGDYQKALEYLKLSNHVQDSLETETSRQKLKELQVEYGMDKLAYENAQLEIRNKRLMLIGLLVVLTLVILLCIYLYLHLQKERRMKEEMARLKLRAEESEKLKTAFINSMCHEIRTPLNAIVGFSGLLLDETLDEDTRRSFPQEIRDSASLLTSLINNMLEVSTLDVSEEKLPRKPADIIGICRQAMDHLSTREIPGVEYRMNMPAGSLIVPTHARYLALVLENLLDNAAKFTRQGSIVLSSRKEGDKLVLDVTDTGSGIPPEKHEEVFGRFTKLDTFSKGNGLGLYVCQLVIKRLSGEIYIDPDYTGGTRIVIVLPAE